MLQKLDRDFNLAEMLPVEILILEFVKMYKVPHITITPVFQERFNNNNNIAIKVTLVLQTR